jgi:hypothetical protein
MGNNAARGTPKGQTFWMRLWMHPECNNCIRYRSQKEQLCLGSKMTLYKAVRQTLKLEMAK